ncbi:M1 family aminopeptidase [Pyxidicoccus xibeiensis]|uniref:M1 family aminopeptidase n=1 Tax=Pyxidicoccus xibeiensis TaxID=2906759 RepID=UPI0020A7E8B1|nr:M1 family aminopeptidase [Pyxidicoccus xibeiensis]MCP3144040.1 aminopeptidase [Pyxidicoccus xibeiensis]
MRTFLAGCLLWCVLSGTPAWSSAPPSPPAAAAARAPVAPEVQLCLQHLKPAERERAAKALGPLDALPLYRVQLEVDPVEREVKGRVQVEVQARSKPITELYLRLTPNAQGRRVALSDAKLGGRPIRFEQPEPTLYRVVLEDAVPPGAAAVLDVAVKATVPRAEAGGGSLLGGFLGGGGGRSGGDYGAFSAGADFISLVGVVPQVPPLDATGRPWDGPQGIGDLALYEPSHVLATITVPSGWAVHATGAPMGEVPERDGRVRFAFAAGAVRDFPILVSRGYERSTATVNGVTVESHYAAKDKAAGERVLKYATSALTEFERRLGPLPYTHFRVVEAPLTGGAGGMEFPGLITVATMLYRGGMDPSEALAGMPGAEDLQALLGMMGQGGSSPLAHLAEVMERTLEFTVAHEVAHQYFAGLVGSDPIHAPVVDESLAQYAALLYIEWKHGKGAAEALRREALVSAYHLYRISGGKDGKADRPTSDFADSFEYSALVYGKAPLLHHASRKLVGDAAFVQALRSYVDAYRFKWTCKECFTRELAKASPAHAKSLERLRTRWWQESHGDADLGTPDLGSLMGGMGMGDLDDLELDPQSKKLLEELLPGLLGQ